MSGDDGKGIKVIVAGLGRTGTMSLQEALRVLGYRPYHMESFLSDASHPAMWRRVAEGTATAEEMFRKVAADGYDATMDNPMCDYFEQQMAMYPDAKVVLSTHPKGAAGWEQSFLTLMKVVRVQSYPFSMTYPNPLGWVPIARDINILRNIMGTVTLGLPPGELTYKCFDHPPGWLASLYEQHNDKVRQTVPKDRLLEYSVKDGWGPLCEFLGKPVPQDPFPHVNDSASIRRVAVGLTVFIYSWVPVTAALCYLLVAKRKAFAGLATKALNAVRQLASSRF
eukprot:TRINITY_DN21564_c0_g1_i1.p1 TRINITY_DN21564_c0_g1~~TRINITY_DN21564_c0_g1_i1.p1  ORF type:complete len:281 (+),score=62.38 TRINITY_DN21564_c0_g1_i1:213-1055(+)